MIFAQGVPDLPVPLLLLGLEFPAIMAMLDCTFRDPDQFLGGAPDRKSWQGWLVVSIVTVPILLGYGILIGYYYAVIRRNTPGL